MMNKNKRARHLTIVKTNHNLQEERAKKLLEKHLHSEGWETTIAWGRKHGTDIVAKKRNKEWRIEVKGCGSLNPMRVNYFLAILGEILQRMDEEDIKYSIALPDMKQYRDLWENLPALAKKRTGISMLFVRRNGQVEEVK